MKRGRPVREPPDDPRKDTEMADEKIWDKNTREYREMNHVDRVALALIQNQLRDHSPNDYVSDRSPSNLLNTFGDSTRPLAEALVAAVQDTVRIELAAMRDSGELTPPA